MAIRISKGPSAASFSSQWWPFVVLLGCRGQAGRDGTGGAFRRDALLPQTARLIRMIWWNHPEWLPTKAPITDAPTELPTKLPVMKAPTKIPTLLPTKVPTTMAQDGTFETLPQNGRCSDRRGENRHYVGWLRLRHPTAAECVKRCSAIPVRYIRHGELLSNIACGVASDDPGPPRR